MGDSTNLGGILVLAKFIAQNNWESFSEKSGIYKGHHVINIQIVFFKRLYLN